MLDAKVAVVTGAGRGLGRAYAVALAGSGAAVVVNDVDAEAAADTGRAITLAGGAAAVEVGAVGTAEVADALVERAVGEFGRLDVMCTNAGLIRDSTLHNTTDDDFDLVLLTHLRGTFTCARAAARRFRAQGSGGRLILVGSPAGQRAGYAQTAYSAAKSAIAGLTRTWALEYRHAGVTVNAVLPRAVTRMTESIPGLRRLAREVADGQPVPPSVRAAGLGTPEDVAALVVFLASDAAAEVTGQCFGAGGDRLTLWCHPAEVFAAFRPGGWSAQEVAEVFSDVFAPHLQDYLQPPPPPASKAGDRRSTQEDSR